LALFLVPPPPPQSSISIIAGTYGNILALDRNDSGCIERVKARDFDDYLGFVAPLNHGIIRSVVSLSLIDHISLRRDSYIFLPFSCLECLECFVLFWLFLSSFLALFCQNIINVIIYELFCQNILNVIISELFFGIDV
jgi:hypothetical protein